MSTDLTSPTVARQTGGTLQAAFDHGIATVTALPASSIGQEGAKQRFYPGWLYAASLCAASGMADAVGFIQTGIFAANMTGNTVLAGLSVASGNWTVAFERVMTLATFFGGAVIGRAMLRAARGRSWLPLAGEAGMLAGACFIAPHDPLAIWLIAAAMGVQSTGMTRFGNVTISTVVVTSTLSRLAESAVDTIVPRRHPANTGAAIAAPGVLAAAWLCYGLGALAAALLLKVTAFTLLVPAAIVLMVALLSLRTARAASS